MGASDREHADGSLTGVYAHEQDGCLRTWTLIHWLDSLELTADETLQVRRADLPEHTAHLQ